MLIRFLIGRFWQAGASSTRNRQWAWPPLKRPYRQVGRKHWPRGHINMSTGGLADRDQRTLPRGSLGQASVDGYACVV